MSILDDGIVLGILQDAVAASIQASSVPTLPVKYIGRSWTPPNDQKWLELVFLPNNSGNYWGDEIDYRGSFRIILHWPNNDEGVQPPLAALKTITSYFAKDRLLQNVQIYDTPKLGGVLEAGLETLYPTTLRYQSYRL